VRTYRWLSDQAPGRHAFHELRGYSHLDVFMGRHAARDVFPLMLGELERTAEPAAAGAAR
jgi:hypothetical protein